MTHARHLKSHSGSGQICPVCGKQFAFASQLKTHQTVHSDEKHKCTYGNYDKSFKNTGDLTRYLKQHTSKMHKCPDCDYKNADIRNFESHRFRHSQITRYVCEYCDEEFVYNAQY